MSQEPETSNTQTGEDETRTPHRWWIPVIEFATHVIVGTAIFFIIFLPAILLNLCIHKVEGSVSSWLVVVMVGTEILLVAADIIAYAVFLFYAVRRAIRAFARW